MYLNKLIILSALQLLIINILSGYLYGHDTLKPHFSSSVNMAAMTFHQEYSGVFAVTIH